MDTLRPHEPGMEDIRNVDGPTAQWDVEGGGHPKCDKRADIMRDDIYGRLDLLQLPSQPMGEGILCGRKPGRAGIPQPRQTQGDADLLEQGTERIPDLSCLWQAVNEDNSHHTRIRHRMLVASVGALSNAEPTVEAHMDSPL